MQMGGPYIAVKVGRRDTRISLKASADKIPRSTATVDQLLAFFTPLGITVAEAVALMGEPSITTQYYQHLDYHSGHDQSQNQLISLQRVSYYVQP
jgi:hypothetical protein